MNWNALRSSLSGDLYTDESNRRIYSTDASAYREIPRAVAIPKDDADVVLVVKFANENKIGLTPRTAGTSLAGQTVGGGIIVDISKHFNECFDF